MSCFIYLAKITKIIILFLLAVFFIKFFIVELGKVNGRSMEMTLVDGEIFMVNKFVYLFSAPKRGDLVQIINPDIQELLVKRVIGLPGEQIIVKNNEVYIKQTNEEIIKLNESYLNKGSITSTLEEKIYPVIEPHSYFVMGDNRSYSTDSRHYGDVHRSFIVGKVIFWPGVNK